MKLFMVTYSDAKLAEQLQPTTTGIGLASTCEVHDVVTSESQNYNAPVVFVDMVNDGRRDLLQTHTMKICVTWFRVFYRRSYFRFPNVTTTKHTPPSSFCSFQLGDVQRGRWIRSS